MAFTEKTFASTTWTYTPRFGTVGGWGDTWGGFPGWGIHNGYWGVFTEWSPASGTTWTEN